MRHEIETRSSTVHNTFKCVVYNVNLYMQTSISRNANFYNLCRNGLKQVRIEIASYNN